MTLTELGPFIRASERAALAAVSYGVSADGTTDDAAALQDVIDVANTAWATSFGPTVVQLPGKPIRLNSTVRLKSGVVLRGTGGVYNQDGTTFLWGGSAQTAVFDSDAGNYLSAFVAEDFGIQPVTETGAPPAAGTGHGFQIYAVTNNSAFRRIHVSRLTGDAFNIGNQTLAPADDTAALNCVFEQVFVSTCGGYGIRTDGWNAFVASMCDNNGNRGGDFYLANGISNQANVLILGHLHESGGDAPSQNPIVLDDMGDQVVVLVAPTFSGPNGAADVISITGATGARPIVVGGIGFGYTNWIDDAVLGIVEPFSIPFNYFGASATAHTVRVRGTAPIVDLYDQNGTTDQRRFFQTIAGNLLALQARTDAGALSRTLASWAFNNGQMTIDGNLIFATDNSGDIGASGATRPRDLFLGRNARIAGNLGVGNSAAATTLGSVARKIEVFDASGSSLGFVPVYDAIT